MHDKWINSAYFSARIESLNESFRIYLYNILCKFCATGYLLLYLHRGERQGLFTSPPRKIRGNGRTQACMKIAKTGVRRRHAEIPTRNNIFLWERKIWCGRNRHAVFWSMKNGSLNSTNIKQSFADLQIVRNIVLANATENNTIKKFYQWRNIIR